MCVSSSSRLTTDRGSAMYKWLLKANTIFLIAIGHGVGFFINVVVRHDVMSEEEGLVLPIPILMFPSTGTAGSYIETQACDEIDGT
jgi:hypothetical protein